MAEILSVSSSKEPQTISQPESAGHEDWGASIPAGYGQTCVVLLPRDPVWMFCYWELTEVSARDLKSKYGEDVFAHSTPTLRRFCVKLGRKEPQILGHVDTPVVLSARNWYLQAEEEGSSWFVELGLKFPNGEFIVIARSNYITLPRGRVSNLTDERWAKLHAKTEELLALSGGGKMGAGSLEIAKKIAEHWNVMVQTSSRIGSGGVSSSLISALRKT